MWLSELRQVFGRRRTKALLGALAAIPILAAVAVRLSANGSGGGGGPGFFDQITHNGVFVALGALLVAIPFFIPLTVSVVSGDTLAGEANLGTLRALLARPVGRTRLLLAKLASAMTFCLVGAMVVVVAGLIAGAILFPLGRVTTLSGFTISLADGVLRSLLAGLIVGASMFGLACIGLFMSTLTEVPVGAMAATAAIAIAIQIADGISQLHAIQPYLLTHHWLAFGDLMRVPINFGNIVSDMFLQLAWGAVFLAAAWARFTTHDVLA